jgi:hypothetical protein
MHTRCVRTASTTQATCLQSVLRAECSSVTHLLNPGRASIQSQSMHPCRCLESVLKAQWSSVTHLLSDSPSGKKYEICQSRGIPCVNTGWLAACMAHGCLVPVEDHFVDAPAAPAASGASQGAAIPDRVGATQAAHRPQYISQGALRCWEQACAGGNGLEAGSALLLASAMCW